MGFFDRVRDRFRRKDTIPADAEAPAEYAERTDAQVHPASPMGRDYADRNYFRSYDYKRPWYRSNLIPLLLLPLLLIPLLIFAAVQVQNSRIAQQRGSTPQNTTGTQVGIGGAPNATATPNPKPQTTALGSSTTDRDLVAPVTDQQRVDKFGDAAQGIGGSGYTPNSVPSTGRGR